MGNFFQINNFYSVALEYSTLELKTCSIMLHKSIICSLHSLKMKLAGYIGVALKEVVQHKKENKQAIFFRSFGQEGIN